ncbi:nucleotidyltransferase domain-containing protein [Streptomyces montanisoli]|uniref:Nucleotidyltransferase domain-containing protein n=1 Tax=Streptomyces montanisoli TaxID=2798581 RepID=A0A940MIA5_9ACTN|nr:nucleotidyltransferase domain-containing protein [Streptomyces montanisoli]MBP0460580.1 nucleotidyltransferase domain-containing protein [Streptomyces montanisoli]
MTESPESPATERLLARFTADLPAYVVALWAHGSLAMGDYQEGRSDLDLVAVVDTGRDGNGERALLAGVHRALMRDEPLARLLHCTYLSRSRLADADLDHFTWAHGEPFERPVTPVARQELLCRGRVLRGPSPASLLPPLGEGELAAFVRRDLREYWYPAAARAELWTQDIWVALGMVTLARAAVTLREGRLVTKGEALGELARMGAPAAVVEDVRALRYDRDPVPAAEPWRSRRGEAARAFVRAGIDHVLGDDGEATPGAAGPVRAV